MSRSPITMASVGPPLRSVGGKSRSARFSTDTSRVVCFFAGPARQREAPVRTYSPKPADIQRAWHVVDADGLVLGRLSTEVARVLRGKHKPIFAPHVDTGDFVIVVNAAKIVTTSDKAEKKFAYSHSGYPGGLRKKSYADLLATKPEEVIRRSVKGMLPKGPLGRKMLKKLKVYAGPAHPHAAQSPQPLDLAPVA